MVRKIFVIIYTFIILLCSSKSAIACSIPYMEMAYAEADDVFIGKINTVTTLQKASADLVQYKSGRLLDKSDWYWEKSLYNVLNATIEVSEMFKGIPSKTIEVYTPTFDDYRREYTVPFKEGEIFLVYAHKNQSLYKSFEHILIGKQKNEVIAEADKFNMHLPLFVTTTCARTMLIKHSGYAENEINRLRSFAKNGLPKLPKGVRQPPANLPLRIFY